MGPLRRRAVPPPAPQGFDRPRSLRRLSEDTFDVLVVGGGITGAGVALDAVTRGLRTALVERHDFASGTSSRSSKLVHGGLRYLQGGQVRLVSEALRERQRLRRAAPHLVSVVPFLIPVLRQGGTVDARAVTALRGALWIYDIAGGARIGHLHQRVSAEEALAQLPCLDPAKVVGGLVYYDAQTDDARLTLTVVRTAADHGAVAANWCRVASLSRDSHGMVRGATVVPAGADPIDVRARVVINATGVWTDSVRSLDDHQGAATLRPAKGVHMSVPRCRLGNIVAAVLPACDGRSVFVVPHGRHTYIGTTDTAYDGPLDEARCTPADVAYLLDSVNGAIVEPLNTSDVVATWAGLRPLLAEASGTRTADLSRRHLVTCSSAGVVTVTGGKLTTYRRMASDAVDVAGRSLGCRRRSATARLLLHGATGFSALEALEVRGPARGRYSGDGGDCVDGGVSGKVRDSGDDGPGRRLSVEPALLAHLARRYGGDARTVAAMVAADPGLGRPLVAGLPHVRAEALYAARYEMARTLDDILSRRIPARWLDAPASAAAADDTARLVAADLGWTGDDVGAQVADYRHSVAADRAAAGLPATSAAGQPARSPIGAAGDCPPAQSGNAAGY